MNDGHYIYSCVDWKSKIGISAWSGLVKNLSLAFRMLRFWCVRYFVVHWCSHCGKQYGGFFKNRITMWPSNSILGYISKKKKKKTLIQKDICTPVFIAALFTIAKTWKQSKCPLTNEYIKKVWYIHTMGYYSAMKKKEWNFTICSNMDGFGRHYAKWNKSERERQILHDITYMWDL